MLHFEILMIIQVYNFLGLISVAVAIIAIMITIKLHQVLC